MVLYLRTVAADSLTIRTAPYARQSFADRLSPRRFERFEEVLVRNLTEAGPVVALNPPGTDLAPIGAARETLASDHWQSTITGWMTDAQLIVVGAAPEAISPGFGWELRAGDSHRGWFKTLLVLPPVRNSMMHARWERFTKVFADTAMARHPIPLDPASMLVLLGSIATGWSAVTADRVDLRRGLGSSYHQDDLSRERSGCFQAVRCRGLVRTTETAMAITCPFPWTESPTTRWSSPRQLGHWLTIPWFAGPMLVCSPSGHPSVGV